MTIVKFVEIVMRYIWCLCVSPVHVSFCTTCGKFRMWVRIRLDSVLKEKNSKSKIANIFAKSNYLYLRDNYSYKIALEQLKLKQLPSLGGDLAFLDLTISEKFFKSLNQSINIIVILI